MTARPVVFLGTEDAAAACALDLASRGLVAAVVTPPERRRGRGGRPEPTVCGAAAAAAGLPVLPVEDVNAEPVLEQLRVLAPRLLVVVAFGQYLRRPVRDLAPLGAVNLHFSLLPRWRGAAPVQRALLADDSETGVSVQRVTARLDAGPVLASSRVAIAARDDAPSLRARLIAAGAPVLAGVVERLLAGERIEETVQDEALATSAPSIDRAEGDLDFGADDAPSIDRRIRALEPWPRCRARLVRARGEPLDVVLREAFAEPGRGRPGEVIAADGTGIRVAARDGVLRITRLQRAGGRDVDAGAFVNGFPTSAGDRLESLRG